MSELRDYQIEAVGAVRARHQNASDALLVMPTGAGKTRVMLEVVRRALGEREDARCMILLNRVQLVEQTAKVASSHIEEVGLFCASLSKNAESRLTIGSVQSVSRGEIPTTNLIVVDEAHQIEADMYNKIIESARAKNPDLKLLGCTATPYTASGGYIYGPEKIFKSVTYTKSLSWMISRGYLVPPRTKHMAEAFDSKGVPILAGEYNQGALEDLVLSDNSKLERQVKDALSRLTERKKCAWACVSIKHAEAVYRLISEDAALVHSEMTPTERAYHMRSFEEGAARHMVFVSILSQGYDCFDAKTEILTSAGWRNINSKIGPNEKVYSLNKAGKLELVPIEKTASRFLRTGEKLISIKNQHFDICITENHRFCHRGDDGKIYLSKFAEMPQRAQMIIGSIPQKKKPGIGLSYSEAWVLGMFWADGSESRGRVEISQSKPAMVRKIRNLLRQTGIDYWERKRLIASGYKSNHKYLHSFYLPKGTHSGSYARRGISQIYGRLFTKKIQDELMQMNVKEFMALWDGYLDGNGSWPKNKNKLPFATISRKEHLDFFTHKAIELGFSCAYGSHLTKNKVRVYQLRISEKLNRGLNLEPKRKHGRGATIKFSSARQRVWCISNKNETLITRRNGRVVVMGNCPAIDSIVLMRPTRSSGLYVQTVGRGLRVAPGKQDCLVLDYGRVVENCGPLDAPYVRQKGSKNKDAPIPMKFCPACLEYMKQADMTCPACGFVFEKPKKKPANNLTDKPHDGNLLGSVIKPEWRTVERKVSVEAYLSKKGNRCYRVYYHCRNLLMRTVQEYVMPDRMSSHPVFLHADTPDFADTKTWDELYTRSRNNLLFVDAGLEAVYIEWDGMFPKIRNARFSDDVYESKKGFDPQDGLLAFKGEYPGDVPTRGGSGS